MIPVERVEAHIAAGPLGVRLVLEPPFRGLVPPMWLSADAPTPELQLTLRAGSPEGAVPVGERQLRARAVSLGFSDRLNVVEGVCTPDFHSLRHSLRLATQPLLLARGWFMLHASTVVRGGRAHVISGVSGAGKTTTALRLVGEGWELLGDEVALLGRATDGRWHAASHPGQPRPGAPGRLAPLVAVHLLRKGDVSRARLSPANGASRLLSNVMAYGDVREDAAAAFPLVAELATSVPIFETHTTLDPSGLEALTAPIDEGP